MVVVRSISPVASKGVPALKFTPPQGLLPSPGHFVEPPVGVCTPTHLFPKSPLRVTPQIGGGTWVSIVVGLALMGLAPRLEEWLRSPPPSDGGRTEPGRNMGSIEWAKTKEDEVSEEAIEELKNLRLELEAIKRRAEFNGEETPSWVQSTLMLVGMMLHQMSDIVKPQMAAPSHAEPIVNSATSSEGAPAISSNAAPLSATDEWAVDEFLDDPEFQTFRRRREGLESALAVAGLSFNRRMVLLRTIQIRLKGHPRDFDSCIPDIIRGLASRGASPTQIFSIFMTHSPAVVGKIQYQMGRYERQLGGREAAALFPVVANWISMSNITDLSDGSVDLSHVVDHLMDGILDPAIGDHIAPGDRVRAARLLLGWAGRHIDRLMPALKEVAKKSSFAKANVIEALPALTSFSPDQRLELLTSLQIALMNDHVNSCSTESSETYVRLWSRLLKEVPDRSLAVIHQIIVPPHSEPPPSNFFLSENLDVFMDWLKSTGDASYPIYRLRSEEPYLALRLAYRQHLLLEPHTYKDNIELLPTMITEDLSGKMAKNLKSNFNGSGYTSEKQLPAWQGLTHDQTIVLPSPPFPNPQSEPDPDGGIVYRLWWMQNGRRHTPADIQAAAEALRGGESGAREKLLQALYTQGPPANIGVALSFETLSLLHDVIRGFGPLLGLGRQVAVSAIPANAASDLYRSHKKVSGRTPGLFR